MGFGRKLSTPRRFVDKFLPGEEMATKKAAMLAASVFSFFE